MVAKDQYSPDLLFSNILKESMVKKIICGEIGEIRIQFVMLVVPSGTE